MSDSVRIIEVSPRDGLQHEASILNTNTKRALIHQLSTVGLQHIEVTSFVSAKAIPALADHNELMQGLSRHPGVSYSALVPNLQGYQRAHAAGVDAVAVFTAPSETFCQRNINCSVAQSLQRFAPIFAQALRDNLPVRAYISCVFSCPYEGSTRPEHVVALAETLCQMGANEIALGDTTGTGTVQQVKRLLSALTTQVPANQCAVHFHNTYGQALVNIVEALQWGVLSIDASVAGLGGCPYARAATGNVATEDLVYCLEGLGVDTGIDLPALIACGKHICKALGKTPVSFLGQLPEVKCD